MILWGLSRWDQSAGSCCKAYFQAGHPWASFLGLHTCPDSAPHKVVGCPGGYHCPVWPTYCLQQGDHYYSYECSCLWGHGPVPFVHPFADEGRSCCPWLVQQSQDRASSLSLQLGERPHSSWHWREWQQLMRDRMWPWLPVWRPHSPAVVMWQCATIYCHVIETGLPCLQNTSVQKLILIRAASSSWDRTRVQRLFRILSQWEQESLTQNLFTRKRELYCNPLLLLIEIFPKMYHPEHQSHYTSVCTGRHDLQKMTLEVAHVRQSSTTAGSCQHGFDYHGLCDRELICAYQTISSQATEVLTLTSGGFCKFEVYIFASLC